MALSAPRPSVKALTSATTSAVDGVQHQLRGERFRHLAPQFVRLAKDDARATQMGDGGVQAADGAGAHDQHGVTQRRADVLVAGLHRAQRLAKGTLREAQRGRHLVDGAAGQGVCREDAVLGQPTVEAGGDADHGHVVAEVVETDAAVPALEAMHVRSDRKVVADLVAGDLGAHLDDLAGELVAGRGDGAVGRALTPAAQVRATHATRPDGQQHAVVGTVGDGNVDQLDGLRAGQSGSFHVASLSLILCPTAPPGWVSPKSSTE